MIFQKIFVNRFYAVVKTHHFVVHIDPCVIALGGGHVISDNFVAQSLPQKTGVTVDITEFEGLVFTFNFIFFVQFDVQRQLLNALFSRAEI